MYDLFDSMDCSPSGFSVYGILQARILEWVTMPSSRGSLLSRDRTRVSHVSCIGRRVLYHKCHLGSPFNRRLTENILGWPKSLFNVRGNSNELFSNLNCFGGVGVFKVYILMVGLSPQCCA